MFGDIGVDVAIRKVTEDPNHPAPWRWWFGTDTPLGFIQDEGLASTEDEAVQDAGDAFCKAVQDKDTQTRTAQTVRIEVNLDEVLALADSETDESFEKELEEAAQRIEQGAE